ncbi:tyrosine--tRNA ligase [Thalassoglobus polymorphus]|uniref:Tyrosine--tRNA ligase n=1 Tax=Thalassoglobus polymorphus TaxID=2527994 RepID=A0A517QU69_9PLAN|nr:tyrosine--tRNA ligase [Thalassoglobus polymorphus]QDT35107.1 Tyrosine--tRNA ligase [Thalassoglobus polymorphus]
MSFPPVDEQLQILRRGVEKIVPEEELAAKLQKSRETNTPLRVKYGIDPTAADVHLGHTVPLRKMRQFQDLGHQAVIIIGNATAMVGDPSGRDEARTKKLSEEDIEENAKYYLNQVGKVIDLDNAEVHRNGDWFGKMGLVEILNLCGKVTVAQLLTRDDFAKRMKAEVPIFLHECLYPVMQAWDSVVIQSDVELGGTEQLYSFMLARDLQKDQSQNQQIGIMSPILVGTDGTRRMGKSLGNYIGISESPYEMMKKFMQLPDDVMKMYYELLTGIDLDEVDQILAGHPKEAKVRLGKTVISEYHDETAAEDAAARWQKEIGEGNLPSEIPEKSLSRALLNEEGSIQAAQLLKELELVPSTSQAIQRIKGGAVFFLIDGEKTKIADRGDWIKIVPGMIVRAGKKDWAKVQLGE